MTGGSIVFRAETEYENGSSTRTEYSGVGTGGKERIDWVSGDRVRIYSDQARCLDGTTPYSDYVVTGVTAGTGAKESSSYATISQVSANGLQWGRGTHKFYSVYPSPAQNSSISFSSPNVVTETIVSPQGYTSSGSTLKPDMDYAYMFAAVQTEASSSVSLSYQPMFTAFQFTVMSEHDADLTIRSFTLSSSSLAMVGSCTATMTAQTTSSMSTVSYSGFPQATAGNKSVMVSFNGGSGITIHKSGSGTPTSLTFTVFALPRDYDDLSVVFDTSAGEKKLELKNGDGTPYTFMAGRKYAINNFGIPGEWTYTIDALQSLSNTYSGGEGQLSQTSAFRSMRTRTATGASEPVPYILQYSTDNGGHWTDGVPDWLVVSSPSSYAGTTSGETLSYKMASLSNSPLRSATAPVTDLSRYNPATNTVLASGKRTTANCYVVKAPGTYKFPLVYGNGLKNGSANQGAYRSKSGSTWRSADALALEKDGKTYYFHGYYKDHKNANITQPWITEKYPRSSHTYKAELVWADAPGLVQDVALSTTEDYITFSVPKDFICEGNALIAVLVDGVIAWSWHIWVTSQNLAATVAVTVTANSTTRTYEICPVNVGWSQGATETYDSRSVKIRAYQPSSGRSSTPVTVEQSGGTGISTTGNNPYYQFGRKDPLQAGTGSGSTPKTYYTAYALQFGQGSGNDPTGVSYTGGKCKVSVGTAIQHPYIHYRYGYNDATDQPHDWCSTNYINPWNSTATGYGRTAEIYAEEVTKTVYDPSPVGFSVSPQVAFTAFVRNTNFIWTPATTNVTSGYTYSTSLFPCIAFRAFADGSLGGAGGMTWYWFANVSDPVMGQGSNMRMSSGELILTNTSGRTYAFPVRSIKEK